MALLRSVATVGSLTLVSRVFGFLRDILTAAILGAGPVADAFFVAQRLPNLFRSLFAEGAFSAAFVPLAASALAEGGKPAARAFAEEAFAVLFAVLLAFVVAGEIFMPWLMGVIAPGFGDEPGKFELAVDLTRITFPYLLFISLTALQGGLLNAVDRFAAAAATPILLNLFLIAALLLMARFGWSNGRALAWALTAAGIAQFLWLMVSCARAGVALRLRLPRLTPRRQTDAAHHGTGRVRRRGDTAQPAGLDGAGLAAPDRLDRLSLLCRPAEPAAAWGRRHRGRHRDPAAAVAPGAPRGHGGCGRDAEPRRRTGAAAYAARGGGIDRAGNTDTAGAVCARRVRPGRGGGDRGGTGGLCRRAAGFRTRQGAGARVFRAPEHAHTGQSRGCRDGREPGADDRADASFWRMSGWRWR